MHRHTTWGVILALSLTLLPTTTTAERNERESTPDSRRQKISRVVVKFRPGAAAIDGMLLHRRNGFQIDRTIDQLDMHVIRIPPGKTAEEVIARYERHPLVDFAHADNVGPPAMVPDDTYYSMEWHLPRIAAAAAWDVTTGSPDVTIAILDSGVDDTHIDLASNIVPGWNVFDDNSNTSDVAGHGTAVAGQAGAVGNNGIGVAAPAWHSRIMPVRITNLQAWTSDSSIAAGLVWAADHGADIANISFEMLASPTITSAAQYFDQAGGVVVFAAGNSGSVVNGGDDPFILKVGATDRDDLVPAWSNTGTSVDISAPGVGIITTVRGDQYGSGTGTSASAPIVAAVAALVMSANPLLSGAEVQEVLKQSADDLGTAGWDPSYGWGRVNAARAVALATGSPPSDPDTTSPTVAITSPNDGDVLTGMTLVTASATDDTGVVRVELYYDGVFISADSVAPHTWSFDTTVLSDGFHEFQAIAFDAADNSGESAVVTVTIDNAIPCDCPPDCTVPASAEVPSATCTDGLDNDCDGATDCDDLDCASAAACAVSSCNHDGICDAGEDCDLCPDDCAGGSGASCGNGVCETGNGEDCLLCPNDCAGKQDGKPSLRYCCGDGDGRNPVDCTDNRCGGGLACSDLFVTHSCCGDGVCEGAETGCDCAIDCGSSPLLEVLNSTCGDGLDNDCDGQADCDDPDCAEDTSCPACDNDGVCEPGEDCMTCPLDCAGETRGRRTNRLCCGNGILERAEGDGSICDGNP